MDFHQSDLMPKYKLIHEIKKHSSFKVLIMTYDNTHAITTHHSKTSITDNESIENFHNDIKYSREYTAAGPLNNGGMAIEKRKLNIHKILKTQKSIKI